MVKPKGTFPFVKEQLVKIAQKNKKGLDAAATCCIFKPPVLALLEDLSFRLVLSDYVGMPDGAVCRVSGSIWVRRFWSQEGSGVGSHVYLG